MRDLRVKFYESDMQVALMKFKSTEAMCTLVTSQDYNEVVEDKREGLINSYSYLSRIL